MQDTTSVKAKVINLIASVRTLMRSKQHRFRTLSSSMNARGAVTSGRPSFKFSNIARMYMI